jgi:hypothetical protein
LEKADMPISGCILPFSAISFEKERLGKSDLGKWDYPVPGRLPGSMSFTRSNWRSVSWEQPFYINYNFHLSSFYTWVFSGRQLTLTFLFSWLYIREVKPGNKKLPGYPYFCSQIEKGVWVNIH